MINKNYNILAKIGGYIMGTIICLIFMVAVIGIGFVLPKMYNDSFTYAYGQSIIDMKISFICSIIIIFFLCMLDYKDSIWFIISIIALIVSVGFMICTVYSSAKEITRSSAKAFWAVFMQILSMTGFIITVLTVIVLLIDSENRNK